MSVIPTFQVALLILYYPWYTSTTSIFCKTNITLWSHAFIVNWHTVLYQKEDKNLFASWTICLVCMRTLILTWNRCTAYAANCRPAVSVQHHYRLQKLLAKDKPHEAMQEPCQQHIYGKVLDQGKLEHLGRQRNVTANVKVKKSL